MNDVIQKIVQAVTGKTTPSDPTQAAAVNICELALPKIKSLDFFSEWLEGEKQVRKLWHEQNFLLTTDEAHKHYESQHAAHADLAVRGESLREMERGRSREAWIADFEARNRASAAASSELSKRLSPMRAIVANQIVDTLNAEVADVMLSEAKIAKKYGIPYHDSPTVQTLRGLHNFISNRGATVILELLK